MAETNISEANYQTVVVLPQDITEPQEVPQDPTLGQQILNTAQQLHVYLESHPKVRNIALCCMCTCQMTLGCVVFGVSILATQYLS